MSTERGANISHHTMSNMFDKPTERSGYSHIPCGEARFHVEYIYKFERNIREWQISQKSTARMSEISRYTR